MQNLYFCFNDKNSVNNSKKIESIISQLPKPIVFTNGVFDILHIGHVRYLYESKKLGASLVVAINSNKSTKILEKGLNRPITDEKDRAEIISFLKPVDLCIIFNQKTPEALIKIIKPKIYTKGNDYNEETIPYMNTLNKLKIQTVFVPLIKNKSSTKIIDKIKNI